MGDGHARASGLLDDQSGPEQALPSDALSAVLRAVSLTGTCFFVVEATGPWWAEVPCAAAIGSCILPGAQQLVSYHVVTEGRCWAGLENGASLWAEAGDIVVIPHGDCYALASAPGVVGEQPVDDSKAFFRRADRGPAAADDSLRRLRAAEPPGALRLSGMQPSAVQSSARAVTATGSRARDARTGLPPPGATGGARPVGIPRAFGGQRRRAPPDQRAAVRGSDPAPRGGAAARPDRLAGGPARPRRQPGPRVAPSRPGAGAGASPRSRARSRCRGPSWPNVSHAWWGRPDPVPHAMADAAGVARAPRRQDGRERRPRGRIRVRGRVQPGVQERRRHVPGSVARRRQAS